MLQIYNMYKKYVTTLNDYKDLCITTRLDTGVKELSFSLPLTDENIAAVAEEYYLRTADYEYIIKEINMDKNDFFKVYCKPNIEDLKGGILPIFDGFRINVEDCLQKILDESASGWKLSYCSKIKSQITYQLAQTNAFDLLQLIREDLRLEYFYNTKEKTLYVYDKMGADKGILFTNDIKLSLLTRQGSTYDFATVIYPYGKDGLSIKDINNGKEYIENHSYSDKVIPIYWHKNEIEHAETLKAAAEIYLSSICAPVVCYEVKSATLPKKLKLGDDVIIADKLKKTRIHTRAVTIIQYPDTPEKDKIELANMKVDFAKTFNQFMKNYATQIQYIKKNIENLS